MDVLAAAADLAHAADDAHDERGQRTTTEQRWSVVSMNKDGRSARYIARKLNINRATVRDILARYDATGSPLRGKLLLSVCSYDSRGVATGLLSSPQATLAPGPRWGTTVYERLFLLLLRSMNPKKTGSA